MLKPSSEILPLPPLPFRSCMSRPIGLLELEIDPTMCTEPASDAAAFVASKICVADLAARPLPEEEEEEEEEDEEDEPPQPASAAVKSTAASAEVVGELILR